MMPRRRLLIVSSDQFGYHTDSFSYCRHLRPWYDITYLGWDYALPRVELEGVRVLDVPRRGGKLRRTLRLVRAARREMLRGAYDVVFVVYFRGCSMLTWVLQRENVVMDVRSGCVHESPARRRIENWLMERESRSFKRLTVISESLREYLRLDPRRTTLLPVGGEEFCGERRKSPEIHLLYVGSLNFRDIDRTVDGFARFYARRKETGGIAYDIVGGGDDDVRRRLVESIEKSGCRDVIRYHGRVRYTELKEHFERGTAGVAFFPRHVFFEYQPVTKVFEYLLAGMPVIAVRTFENQRVITESTGVLCDDTAEGFAAALEELCGRWGSYDPGAIQEKSRAYSWRSIVEETLRPLLDAVAGGGPERSAS
jgi:glycosyltransferase involved in cell wall biosynthesis